MTAQIQVVCWSFFATLTPCQRADPDVINLGIFVHWSNQARVLTQTLPRQDWHNAPRSD